METVLSRIRGWLLLKDNSDLGFLALLFGIMIALPLGNALFPDGSALHVSSFTLGVWESISAMPF